MCVDEEWVVNEYFLEVKKLDGVDYVYEYLRNYEIGDMFEFLKFYYGFDYVCMVIYYSD